MVGQKNKRYGYKNYFFVSAANATGLEFFIRKTAKST